MTQILMACALFVLAGARIPALRRKGNDPVFLAAAFAGASTLLMEPPVYTAVDGALGGINLTKLALNSFMIVGLWYLRSAVLRAVTRDDRRSPFLRRLPLTAALTLQALFFVLTGPTSTTTQWGYDYHYRLAGALFSMMLIAFISWSCAEIAWTCFRYVPRMRRSFRVGFTLVGLGCITSTIVMVKMAQEALVNLAPGLLVFGTKNFPFAQAEMLAVVLVGIGLTIPALAGRAERNQAARRLERTVAKVSLIRDKALKGADMERVLRTHEQATPQERLHRMIVEIWDAELAAGHGRSVLTPEDRAYVLLVESDFELETTR